LGRASKKPIFLGKGKVNVVFARHEEIRGVDV
jgi:hypothetical protein